MRVVLYHGKSRQRYTRNVLLAYFSSRIMELILPFSVPTPSRQINLREGILLLGSCFAEEIGAKLLERKFKAVVNPHGILFNPVSILQAIEDYRKNKAYTEEDLLLHEELWHSLSHHGRFSSVQASVALKNINEEIGKAAAHLKTAKWLVITFGSAFAYVNKQTGQVAANCHKIPSDRFDKILVSKEQIVSGWNELSKELHILNPSLRVIFTVSPVRYVRDGLIENNRSKSILLDSVHTIIEKNKNCFYFPAYEFVIDVLRDHRFYKEDLVHPNHLAINYVWEKFTESFCDTHTREFLEEYEPLLRGLNHRPLQEDTEAHRQFKLQLDEKIKALDEKYL